MQLGRRAFVAGRRVEIAADQDLLEELLVHVPPNACSAASRISARTDSARRAPTPACQRAIGQGGGDVQDAQRLADSSASTRAGPAGTGSGVRVGASAGCACGVRGHPERERPASRPSDDRQRARGSSARPCSTSTARDSSGGSGPSRIAIETPPSLPRTSPVRRLSTGDAASVRRARTAEAARAVALEPRHEVVVVDRISGRSWVHASASVSSNTSGSDRHRALDPTTRDPAHGAAPPDLAHQRALADPIGRGSAGR